MPSTTEKHPLDPGEGVKTFIAAGPLKYAAQLMQFYSIDPESAPALTAGSVISSRWGGNKAVNGGEDFTYDPRTKTAGNCIGLPGEGIEGLKEFCEPVRILRENGLRVIMSMSNLPAETPIKVLPELAKRIIDEVNPTALEVNLSCPNGLLPDGSMHPPVSSNSEASGALMQAIRNEIGYGDICLGIKDSPHVSTLDDEMNVEEIRKLAEATSPFIDFVTGINTIGGQDFPELTAAKGKGGMSGPVVADIAKLWLQQWNYFAPDRVAILSCGGVDSENITTELTERAQMGAMLVGGAQEFYRASKPVDLAARWAIASA